MVTLIAINTDKIVRRIVDADTFILPACAVIPKMFFLQSVAVVQKPVVRFCHHRFFVERKHFLDRHKRFLPGALPHHFLHLG